MATRSKPEKMMYRQAVQEKPAPAVERTEETPLAAEPIAQWQDNRGDRLAYLFWLGCFGLTALFVFFETILGFLNKR